MQADDCAFYSWMYRGKLSVTKPVRLWPVRAVRLSLRACPPNGVVGYRQCHHARKRNHESSQLQHNQTLACHHRGLIALLSASANGNAQSKQGDTPLPQFDVISVKPNNSGGPSPMSISPGRASLTNITLRTLIQVAY